jgi:Ni,Fe-hydrogenase III component G
MTTDQVLDLAANLLAPWAAETTRPEPNRLNAVITRENLLNAVKALRESRWGYMTTITGLDLGVEAGQLEALYHFCNNAAVVTLRVRIPRDDAQVPSLCGLIPSATLPEREFSELLGVTVVDTPDPSHLFLPDDWPDDTYPLRKDFVMPAEA